MAEVNGQQPAGPPEVQWNTATVSDGGRTWPVLILTIPLAASSAHALAAGLEAAARIARSGLEVVGNVGPEPNRAQRRRAERGDGERGHQA